MSAPAAPDETADDRAGTVERAPAAKRNPQRPGAHPRRGRRPGNPGTRLAILRSAHELFSRNGYEATSLRAVARAAGVDPGLLRYYFPDKTVLFLQASQIEYDPRLLVRRLFGGGRARLGERILRLALPVWESPIGRSLIASHVWKPTLASSYARMIGQTIEQAAAQLLGELDPTERSLRVAMMQSTLSGLFIARYVVRMPPVSDLPPAIVVRRWAPLLQRIIDGEIG